MVQDFTPASLVHPITPEEIEHRPFASVKKGGVDEAAVRSFLREVATFVEQQQAQSRAREEALEKQVAQLRQQLEHPPVPSGQQLVELVGEEVARTLRTAQESSDEMRGKAEERALRAIRDAQDEAHHIRDEQLELANQNARAIVESARERGREMVGEARALRERVLADLNRRREALQEQLQEVRAGREELAATYRAIKQTFDESTLAFSRFEAGRPFDAVNIDVPPPPLLPPERPEPREPSEPRADARAGALEIGELPHTDEPVEHEVVATEVVEEVAVVSETEPVEPTADVAAAPETETVAPTAEESTPPPESDGTGEVAVSPPPEPESEPVPGPEPPSATKAAPEVPSPPATSPSPAAEPSSGPSTPDLDEIFKRIRAGRIGDPAQRRSERPEPTAPGTGDEPEASAGDGGSTATATAPSGTSTRTLTIAPEVRPEPNSPSGSPSQAPASGTTVGKATAVPPPEPDTESSPDSQALATRDELLTTVAVEVARSCKRALQDEQNELLHNLRRQRRGVSVEKLLPPLVDQVATWCDVLSPSLDQVYIEARANAAGERPTVAAAPRRLVAAMAELLVSPLRDRVSAAVTDSDDSDADAIAQRIGARYREWKGQELDDRIGDVLAATYARGVYDAAPEGARLRWIPAEQGKCSDCDDNSLEPTLRGNRFPTGQPFPPAHPGCRCLLVVIE